MTTILVILATIVGGGVVYGFQQMRVSQLEEQVAKLTTDLSFAESWRETYRHQAEALARELADIRQRRSDAAVQAGKTRRDRKRNAEASDAVA